MEPDELRARLEKRLGGRVDGLRRLSGGASGETWSFSVVSDDDLARRLILRRETRQLVGPRVPEAAIFAAAARAGVPVPAVVVDGEFRNGNLIVGPEGVRAVLDWELTHLGDPMEDLGWLCVKAWRFGSPLRVGGFGAQPDLFRAYERESGQPVDTDVVHWWEV